MELLGDVPRLASQPPLSSASHRVDRRIHRALDDPVEAHLGDVLRLHQIVLEHAPLPTRVDPCCAPPARG